MVKVKICGITNLDDALMCCVAGADALGFVFYDRSPRNIDISSAEKIIRNLPVFVTPVAVLVEKDLSFVRKLVEIGFRTFQIYFDLNDKERKEILPGKFIRALRVSNKPDLSGYDIYDALLLDSYVSGKIGGTGKTFDWRIAAEVINEISLPVILSGGLSPDNVRDAISIARPYGVDVSSSIETRPGRKDEEKVLAFMSSVRDTVF